MAPGCLMPHSQVLSNNSYPEPNQSNSLFDTYFFKVHSNIVLPSTPRPPQRSLSCRFMIGTFNFYFQTCKLVNLTVGYKIIFDAKCISRFDFIDDNSLVIIQIVYIKQTCTYIPSSSLSDDETSIFLILVPSFLQLLRVLQKSKTHMIYKT